jgi:hypothetical protein
MFYLLLDGGVLPLYMLDLLLRVHATLWAPLRLGLLQIPAVKSYGFTWGLMHILYSTLQGRKECIILPGCCCWHLFVFT